MKGHAKKWVEPHCELGCKKIQVAATLCMVDEFKSPWRASRNLFKKIGTLYVAFIGQLDLP